MLPSGMFPRMLPRASAGLAATAMLAAAALLAGCSSSGPSAGPAATNVANAAAEANPYLDPGTSLGRSPAPDFRLTNQFGQRMSLSQFRGKVVLLSFDDAVCTDVCPLTTESMLLAKEYLGKSGQRVQLLGVDANPDAHKVSDVMAYTRAHGMVNQWDFLTGSDAQLKSVWKAYHIAVQIADGDIDHTPALFVVDASGHLRKAYLTQMAYDSVGQSAQVIAAETASLLPSHPKLGSQESLAAIAPQPPTAHISLPSAFAAGPGGSGGTGGSGSSGTVSLGPGKPRLVVFFATWLTETSDLKSELKALNSYAAYAPAHHLPGLTAVDETVTEPSAAAVRSYLSSAGPLKYPVGLDKTGRVADGFHVQDQPWLALVNSSGKITWQHDGWLPLPALEKAAAHS